MRGAPVAQRRAVGGRLLPRLPTLPARLRALVREERRVRVRADLHREPGAEGFAYEVSEIFHTPKKVFKFDC